MPASRITIDSNGVPVEAALSTPEGTGPWPGVVVVHDVTGLSHDIEAISQRIAAEGYVVVTPNLYTRGNALLCVVRIFRELQKHRGQSIDDVLAAKTYLESSPDCNGTVGIVGFCMGGHFALVTAASGFKACAPFYPTPLPPRLDEALDGSCPMVASFGARDPYGRGAPAKLQAVLDRKGVESDLKVYPTAGHSFANQLRGQPFLRVAGFGYDEAATTDAWQRVFAFFDEHLAAEKGGA